MKNRRKSRLSDLPLQLHHGLAVATIALLSVLAHAVAVHVGLDGATAGSTLPRQVVITLTILLVVLPGATYLGARALARFAGPLQRMQEHLEATLRGESRPPLRLREGDPLERIVGLVNRLAERSSSGGGGAETDEGGPNVRATVDDVPAALPSEPEYDRFPHHLG